MFLRYEDIEIVQLDITSRCNAGCPQCPRTGNPILPMTELTIADIKRIFPKEFCSQLSWIYLCGNFGDAMVSNTTLPALKYFHKMGVNYLWMYTNGSGRSPDWWRQLAKILNQPEDRVIFAIDGLADTNHLYRRNTNWNRIMESVEAFIGAGGQAEWQYLVFEHNQHQVEEARALARRLGFIKFQAKATSRFALSEVDEVGEKEEAIAEVDSQTQEKRDRSTPITLEKAALNFHRQAEDYLAEKNLEQAFLACQKALEIQSNFAVAHKTLGNLLQLTDCLEEAMNSYKTALEIQPEFAEVYANMGSVYASQKQWESAIYHYQKALEIRPNFSGVYRNLAKIWTQLGKIEEANEAFQQAVKLQLAQEIAPAKAAKANKESSVELKPASLPQYQNPEIPNFRKAVQEYGGLENYFQGIEINCQSQKKAEIYVSFDAELWPCCYTAQTKYAHYSDTYRTQAIALFEKYGQGFNNLRSKSIKEVLENVWYQKDLAKSWSCSERLEICALVCGKAFHPTSSQML
ncbi:MULTISPECIES: tetratricopeptide repeat protein [unclassified Microcoleus]|uniref:tetratricopeptide repeat protein n=1 Tax=unclassified Microcoleus TaxID=2642155 RepID=UPI002FD51658